MLCVSSAIVLLCSFSVTLAVTFDWINIETKPSDSEIAFDNTQLKLSTFIDGDKAIHYVTGPVTLTAEFDETYMVHYTLQRKNEETEEYEDIPDIPEKTVNICDFIDQFFRNYLLPATRYHNDFPTNGGKVCPLEAGTYHIFPVQGRFQLSASSGLRPSEYKIEFTFQKDGKNLGGFCGKFVSSYDAYEN